VHLEDEAKMNGFRIDGTQNSLSAENDDVVGDDCQQGLFRRGHEGDIWNEFELFGRVTDDELECFIEQRPELDSKWMARAWWAELKE